MSGCGPAVNTCFVQDSSNCPPEGPLSVLQLQVLGVFKVLIPLGQVILLTTALAAAGF